MAHLPLLIPFFLLLIGVHASVSDGSPLPPIYNTSICSKSSWCGRFNISYPFYLSNAIGEIDSNTSYSCGYTDFKVTCSLEGGYGTPTIQLNGSNYTIKKIFYDNSIVVLADTDALRAGRCPRVQHNVTFGQADEWLEYTGPRHDLIFFFGCNATSTDPWPTGFNPDMYRIDCKGFSNVPGNKDSFVFNSSELDASLEYELDRQCSQVIVLPVNGDLPMPSNQTPLPKGGYVDVLNRGFALAWNSSKDENCYQCEQSQGQCAYNQNRAFLGCLCSGGKVRTQACRNTSSSKSFDTDPLIYFSLLYEACK